MSSNKICDRYFAVKNGAGVCRTRRNALDRIDVLILFVSLNFTNFKNLAGHLP